MKQIIFLSVSLLVFSSCSTKKQASNVTGRTDDVYFTVNDTRKSAEPSTVPPRNYNESSLQNNQNSENTRDPDGYSGTYANRMRFFRSGRYYYDSYRPSIVPSLYYNYYSGWNIGLTFVNPRYGYVSGFNSPFSPYYGLNMPFYDPFYANGYPYMMMNGFHHRYYFNPYLYNPCFYNTGYNSYYPYYNPYYNNFYNNNKPASTGSAQNVRRTGTSNNVPTSNTSTNQPQNSTQNNNQNNSGAKWYNGGNNDRSGSGSSGSSGSRGSSTSGGSSGGNNDRGTSGSGGSNRRR